MAIKSDFPGFRNIGRHSNYSRYKSCQPLDIGTGFNYSYDPDDFPERDPDIFRIITLNCNRFPRTLWSESILTCLLLSSLPDVLILQEVKAIPVLNEVVSAVTKSALPGTFSCFSGKEYSSGLNLATVFCLDSLVNSTKSELFQKFHLQSLYSLRRPIQLKTFLENNGLRFMNLHMVSRSQTDNRSIRLACLNEMTDYFDIPGNDEQMIMGGDWNIDSNSPSLPDHFPNFNCYISEYFNSSDHFLVSKQLISSQDIKDCSQYKMDVPQYLQLSFANYLLYMSDHFPVVLDIPVELLT